MSVFEVLDRSSAAQIERVLACATVAGARSLTTRDVGESVLDGNSLAQSVTTARCRDEMPKALLECLVGPDADLPPSIGGLRALGS